MNGESNNFSVIPETNQSHKSSSTVVLAILLLLLSSGLTLFLFKLQSINKQISDLNVQAESFQQALDYGFLNKQGDRIIGDTNGNSATINLNDSTITANLNQNATVKLGDSSGSTSFVIQNSNGLDVASLNSLGNFGLDGKIICTNCIALGSETTGNYVKSLIAGKDIAIFNGIGEGVSPTIVNNSTLNSVMSRGSGTNYGLTFNDPSLALSFNAGAGRLYDSSGNLFYNGTNLTAGGSFPAGTSGQTLRNNGANWIAASNLYNDGTNVGIGTTTPTEALDVNGNITVHSNIYNTNYITKNPENNNQIDTLPLASTWTDSGDAAISDPSDLKRQPQLIKNGSTYYLFYEYITTTGNGNDWRIAESYASSLAGPWTEVTNLLPISNNPGDPDYGYVADPSVLYIPWAEHKWQMWYDMNSDRVLGYYDTSTIGHAYADNPLGPWTKQNTGGVTDIVINKSTAFGSFDAISTHAPECFVNAGVVSCLYQAQGTGHNAFDVMLAVANDSQGLGKSFEKWGVVTTDNTVVSGNAFRLQSPFAYQNVLYAIIENDTYNKYYWVSSADGGKSWMQLGEAAYPFHSFLVEGNKIWGVTQSHGAVVNFPMKFYYLDLENISGFAPLSADATGAKTNLSITNNVYNGYYIQGDTGLYRSTANVLRTAGSLIVDTNVGIGTTTPLSKLSIVSADNAIATDILKFTLNSAGEYRSGIGVNFDAGGSGVANNKMSFRVSDGTTTGQTNVMTLNGVGNVGIGTLTPFAQTTIFGAGQTTSAIADSGAFAGALLVQDSGSGGGNGGMVLFQATGTTAMRPQAAIKSLLTNGTAQGTGDLAFSLRTATSDTVLTEKMRILSSGNVGIGTTSPAELLTLGTTGKIGWEASGGVVDTNLYRSAANTLKTDDLFQAVGGYNSADGTAGLSLNCGVNKGIKSVTTKNGLVTAATCTTNDLTDLAENYGTADPTIEAGDLVAASSSENAQMVNTENGPASKAYIEKASATNASSVIGIISTNPEMKLGEDLFTAAENPRPVALSGRIEVKVNNENGPIKKGDLLTVSSIPGVAAKLKGDSLVSVGTALEDFELASGQIIAFVNISHKFGSSAIVSMASSGGLSVDSLTVAGDALFKGVIKGNDKFAGKITIPAGQTEVRVAKSWESDPLSIVATPSYSAKSWTESVDKTGFTIKVDTASEIDQTISWIAIFSQ